MALRFPLVVLGIPKAAVYARVCGHGDHRASILATSLLVRMRATDKSTAVSKHDSWALCASLYLLSHFATVSSGEVCWLGLRSKYFYFQDGPAGVYGKLFPLSSSQLSKRGKRPVTYNGIIPCPKPIAELR